MPRFRHHIFFCLAKRDDDDPKGCCAAKGSEALCAYAKERIAALGLKGQVRINQAGCLDACRKGPTVVVYPEGVWYRLRSSSDVDRVLSDHVQQGRIVDDLQIFA